MSVRRQIIAALSAGSVSGSVTLYDVDHATRLVDAHAAEVLAEDREKATPTGATATPDTLAAWLRQRFTASSVSWDNLDDTERDYWEHQALAVRRAVARGGFRTPTPEAGA